MRIPRLILVTGIAVAICGLAEAQPVGQPPVEQAMPKPAPVLDLIPAGAMGFVVVSDISKTSAAAEEFLSAIGIAEMLGKPTEDSWLVQDIREKAKLGEGFNEKGGFAVVMLDPHQFDVDLAGILGLPSSQTTTKPADKLPVVILVPGTSVQGVFGNGNYVITQSGDFEVVTLRMGPMLAAQVGDYVALSPTAETLQALISSGKKVSSELTQAQKAEIAEADLTIHVNMKIAGPIIAGMMKSAQSPMATTAGAGVKKLQADIFSLYMDAYSDIFLQMDGMTLGVQFRQAGLKLGVRAAFAPDSDWGQALAEYKPVGGTKLLSKLPDLPYVLAYGGAWQGCPEKVKKLATKMLSKMLATELLAGLTDQTKAGMTEFTEKYYDQTTGFQIYLGGAPAGYGLLGVSMLTEFADAQQGREMIGKLAPIYEAIAKTVAAGQVKDLDQLEITHRKAAELIDGNEVDVIDITFPGLAELSERDQAKLQKLLGEPGLRMRVAAADEKNVVLTFGGSQAMLIESLRTARTGGKMLEAKPVTASLAHMPANPLVLGLFNVANLMDLVENASQTTTGGPQTLPYKMTSQQPVAFAAGVVGSDVTARLYVPSEVVKQGIEFASAATQARMAPPTKPTDDGDF